MTTIDRCRKIAEDLYTLRQQGHSPAEAVEIVAKASRTDADTIVTAFLYGASR